MSTKQTQQLQHPKTATTPIITCLPFNHYPSLRKSGPVTPATVRRLPAHTQHPRRRRANPGRRQLACWWEDAARGTYIILEQQLFTGAGTHWCTGARPLGNKGSVRLREGKPITHRQTRYIFCHGPHMYDTFHRFASLFSSRVTRAVVAISVVLITHTRCTKYNNTAASPSMPGILMVPYYCP